MASTNQPKITISLWILCMVPLLFMLLRFYCKRKRSRPFAVDDALLLASWVFILLFTVLMQIAVNYGLGAHRADIESLPRVMKYFYIGEYFCFYSMPLSKASFCVTLLHLTPVKWQRGLLWFIMMSFIIGMMAVGILQWAQCRPVQRLWDPSVEGTCLPYSVFITVSIIIGSLSSVADFMLALCPWIIIRKVQMPRREKASVIIAMSMGCLAGVACIIKTTYLPVAVTWKDITYNSADLLIWAISESSITVVAASLPFLRPILQRGGPRDGRIGATDGSYRLTESLKSGHTARTNSWPGHRNDPYLTEMDMKDDDSAEKNIWAGLGDKMGRIRQTQEVRIEYAETGGHNPHDYRSGSAL